MRFAYADPPYFGCAMRHYGDHPEAAVYDTIDGHRQLIERLTQFDGWALSMTSGNLHDILPLCPREARIAAWVKPFASFKPGVNPAYCWEPVVFVVGRTRTDRSEMTVRDFCAASITLKRGLTGAKPEAFTRWMLDLIGVTRDDEVVDLFPGSGAVTDAVTRWRAQRTLFDEEEHR